MPFSYNKIFAMINILYIKIFRRCFFCNTKTALILHFFLNLERKYMYLLMDWVNFGDLKNKFGGMEIILYGLGMGSMVAAGGSGG